MKESMREMLTNRILTGLPDAEFVRLIPMLEPVSLEAGRRLGGPAEMTRHVYFPEDAVVSYQADMQDGKSAEVGMVGREGVAGLPALFGARPAAHASSVAVRGSALRARVEELGREMQCSDALRHALLSYAGDFLTQVAQRSACNALHLTEQRLAVWLLLLTERLGVESFEITQERISQHLGVRRAGVSVIAGDMQDRGIIGYTRGRLRVLDRAALERTACECYAAMSTHGRERITA